MMPARELQASFAPSSAGAGWPPAPAFSRQGGTNMAVLASIVIILVLLYFLKWLKTPHSCCGCGHEFGQTEEVNLKVSLYGVLAYCSRCWRRLEKHARGSQAS